MGTGRYAGGMNVIGHGIDIVECERIKGVWDRHGERFLRRVFTEGEIRYCLAKKDPLPSLAGRFAAKEAVLKVLGTGWRGAIGWTDVEVTHTTSGAPRIVLTGHSACIARDLGIRSIQISITHTRRYGAASAIGLGEGGTADNVTG